MFANGFKFSNLDLSHQVKKPILSLLLWWAVSVLVFFSIPPSKLVGYILPAIAPFTIVFALMTSRVIESRKFNKFQIYAFPTLLIVVACGLIAVPFTMKNNISFYQAEQNQIFLLAGSVIIAIMLLLFLFKKHKIEFFTLARLCCTNLSVKAFSAI